MGLKAGNKSKKGFVAIDIDGTTLIEKVDKHFGYSLFNTKSHLRQTLLEYIRMAQSQGYDIVILTARPSIVEHGIRRMNIGTKSTQEIVELVACHGIEPITIYRSGFSLKGKKLKTLIDEYDESAVGILFDDRLDQVEDVRSLFHPRLFSYDINSHLDLSICFDGHIRLREGKKNPFHPLAILEQVLNPTDDTKDYEATQALRALTGTIDKLGKSAYQHWIAEKANQVLKDLALRVYESQNRGYEPEVGFVITAAKSLSKLIESLLDGSLNEPLIQSASQETIGCSDSLDAQPRTMTEKHIKELLVGLSILSCLEKLKVFCIEYQNHLKGVASSALDNDTEYSQKLLKAKLEEVQDLLNTLESDDLPFAKLKVFSEKLQKYKADIARSRHPETWYADLLRFLAKIPLLGAVFKPTGENFVEVVEKISQEYDTTIKQTPQHSSPYEDHNLPSKDTTSLR